jgi:ATP-dependent DNA ligase
VPLNLPFQPPVPPMLAKLSHELPEGDGWLFEPKWDGFRAIIFKAGNDLYIQSRDTKPLGRYFPELEVTLRRELPDRCVLDGEIVIATGDHLDFDALLLRIHPAASRVAMLAAEKPSAFVAWDLLAYGDEDLREVPQATRRERLLVALAGAKPPVFITPATNDRAVAQKWFEEFEGAGLDGVMAKPVDAAYAPNKRAMLKIKHARTADCVVAGFRWYKGGKGTLVGSLLLALYDAEGTLHHVGVASSFKQSAREELAKMLEPYRENARETHPWKDWAEWQDTESAQRKPGATSRWNRGKDLSWEPLRLELVAEVSYDHMQGTRFRHATHLERWRPDKPVGECTYAQLEEASPFLIKQIFGGT